MSVRRSDRDVIGRTVADLRKLFGWTQRQLAGHAGVSQSWVSLVENSRAEDLTFGGAERLLGAMGARLVITVEAPILGDRARQRDAAHLKCVAHVAARLRRLGWLTETEVAIGTGRARGWIDILAFHPPTGDVLVIEIKTEIHDVGAIQRTLGWYASGAWAVARRLGWRPIRISVAMLLLATEANDLRVRANREAFAEAFPARAPILAKLVAGVDMIEGRRWGLAMIDPRSRRNGWLRPLRVDGRRSGAPYADYADFVRKDSTRRR